MKDIKNCFSRKQSPIPINLGDFKMVKTDEEIYIDLCCKNGHIRLADNKWHLMIYNVGQEEPRMFVLQEGSKTYYGNLTTRKK